MNGRSRVVDLPQRAVDLLKAHKHLRGRFVFRRDDGRILQNWDCESQSKKHDDAGPLARVCRRAGLRRVGWHACRHSYASHLVMRGANLLEVKAQGSRTTSRIRTRAPKRANDWRRSGEPLALTPLLSPTFLGASLRARI